MSPENSRNLNLSKAERQAIVKRDENRCQGCGIFQFCPRDVPNRIVTPRLEVHHILPRGYANTLNFDPNYPENLITLCTTMHRGHPQSIHPDTHQATWDYRQNKNAFSEMMEARRVLLQNHKIYWNDQYDRQLNVIATRNTQYAEHNGWIFPKRQDFWANRFSPIVQKPTFSVS